jgi:hypothetical protein
MQTLAALKRRTRHDAMLKGDNRSYLALGRFPTVELARILPPGLSVPSDAAMSARYPMLERVEGLHPFVLLCSSCRDVHDVLTEVKLRPYRELMCFIPVTCRRGGEERLCSYVPVLYLDYLIGVIGGLYLGLRKQFRPQMRSSETETSGHFVVGDVLEARFEKREAGGPGVLHPFFARTLENPTVTRSYVNRTRFYTTTVDTASVVDAASEFVWRFKGSVVRSDPAPFACYAEYQFTTSQAMSYDTYFHSRRGEVEGEHVSSTTR